MSIMVILVIAKRSKVVHIHQQFLPFPVTSLSLFSSTLYCKLQQLNSYGYVNVVYSFSDICVLQ